MNVLSVKKISLVTLLILIVLTLLMPDILLAQESVETAKVGGGAWYETILWTFVNSFFGLLVWIAGTLLNVSVSQFVVGFGDLFKTQGLGFAVDHLWTLVRDIFNLTFIFGLVYIGFKMILRTDDSNAKRMLVHIILAALLVNFSLFFAKAIVDFSNIAATQIAQGFYDGSVGEYAVSDRFMNVLGLSGIWGTDGEFLKNVTSGQGNGIGYIFGTMVIFIITAFVFFAGAILLLIRFVVLNFYLILSPIMFLGWVFPNMGDASSRYWKSFLNQAFLAPAYLLMLYFSYYILKEFNNLTADKNNYAMIFSGKDPSAAMNIFPYFVITAIFLLASVMVAKKMSTEGASWAINTSKSVTGRLAFGLPAMAGQRTAGLLANKLSNTERFRELAGKSKVFAGAMKGTRAIADSSFDVRRVGGFGKKLDIGEGKAGGYTTRLKEVEKEDKDFAESLERKVRDSDGNLIEEVKKVIDSKVKSDEVLKDLLSSKENLTKDKSEKETTITEEEKKLTTLNKPLENQLSSLEQKLATEKDAVKIAQINTDIEKVKTVISNNTNKSNTIIKDLREKLNTVTAGLAGKTKEIEKREDDLRLQEEANIRYKDVNAFRKRREEDAELYSNKWLVGGGSIVAGGAAVAGGLAVAPAVAIVLAGAGIAKSISETNKKGANAILNTYGTSGLAKMKNEKRKKDLKILAEAQKDAGEVPEAPKA